MPQSHAFTLGVDLDKPLIVIGKGEGVEQLGGTQLGVATEKHLWREPLAMPGPKAPYGDAGAPHDGTATEFATKLDVGMRHAKERLLPVRRRRRARYTGARQPLQRKRAFAAIGHRSLL